MKKTTAGMAALLLCATLVGGCATSHPIGLCYTQLKLPVAVGSGEASVTKVGTAECVSYFGLVTTGDASIATAKRNGGITKVEHVDWEVENILGFIGKYKIIVYGE